MGTVYKIFVFTLFLGVFIYARTGNANIKVEKKVKIENYLVKDTGDTSNNQLERKRVHKRRRKIKKPVKGLR